MQSMAAPENSQTPETTFVAAATQENDVTSKSRARVFCGKKDIEMHA
jgi:hypothetical protein